jgi:hypothetical protein
MASVACALTVLHAVLAAAAFRHDVIGFRCRRRQLRIALHVDLAQRITCEDQLAPAFMLTAVAAARSGSAPSIELAPRTAVHVTRAITASTQFAAARHPADLFCLLHFGLDSADSIGQMAADKQRHETEHGWNFEMPVAPADNQADADPDDSKDHDDFSEQSASDQRIAAHDGILEHGVR